MIGLAVNECHDLLVLPQIFYLSLGFYAVTMTIYRLDVVHAPIADSGLSAKFALFLLLPDQSGSAAGHYTGDAVVGADQSAALLAVVS